MINKFKKIVIKIGSSSIIDEKTKKVRKKWLNSLCKDISFLIKENKKIAIVSSGAIALGKKFITKKETLHRLEDKQAAAAIGQIELVNCWKQTLKKNEINWLNNYHQDVFNNLKNFMNKSELLDLKQACSKI